MLCNRVIPYLAVVLCTVLFAVALHLLYSVFLASVSLDKDLLNVSLLSFII
jgi:hypothetical protein